MNLKNFIQEALAEDIGREDITSVSIIPPDEVGTARIFAKQELVICGHRPASMVFQELGCEYILGWMDSFEKWKKWVRIRYPWA